MNTSSKEWLSRKNAWLLLWICAFLILLVSGCQLLFGKPPVESTGSVRIVILDSNLRAATTLMPTISDKIDHYYIEFSGAEPVLPVRLGAAVTEHTQTGLAIGYWNIEVSARDESELILASAGGNYYVVTGSNQFEFLLEPSTGGTGSVALVFDWTLSGITTINEVTATLTQGETPTGFPLDIDEEQGQKATWIASGLESTSYGLLVEFFYRIDEATVIRYGLWDGVLQIFNNLPTEKNIELSAEDFEALPSAPTDLSYTELQGGISLAWTDTSPIESGFIVERSATEDGIFVSFDENPEDVTSFVIYDPDHAQDAAWYYRVRAYNQIGLSAPSNVVAASWIKPTVLSVEPTWTQYNEYWKRYEVVYASNFSIVFSESMDPSVTGSFELSLPESFLLDSSNSTMSFSKTTYPNDTLTIDPVAPLPNYSPQEWKNLLVSGFADAAGNEMLDNDESDGEVGFRLPDFSFYNWDNTIPTLGSSTLVVTTTTTSATISWTKATDGAFPQDSLRYRVYHSTHEDAPTWGTFTWINATGISPSDRTLSADLIDQDTYTITGLEPGTTYYFNVIVSDPNDNPTKHNTATEATLEVGTVTLTINIVEPTDAAFTITDSNGPVETFEISRNEVLNINLGETYTSYSWRIDGVEVASTQNLVGYEPSGLAYGVHRLSLYVNDNGRYYSWSIVFTVVNSMQTGEPQ